MPAHLHFSRIGLGCVTFGREIEESAAHRLLDHAVEHGVTFFDTAAAYSNGASESIIGRWLAARQPAEGTLTIGTKLVPPYEPAAIRRSVEGSLRRLRVEQLDLLYLHRWDATAESEAALRALDEWVRTGKVGALGVSNATQDELARVTEIQARCGLECFRAVQNNHNYAVREAPPEFRRWCAGRGIGVVTYSPLGAGFLTGKHRHGVQPGTRFALVPGHQDVYFHPEAYERLAELEQLAARTGHSKAALALAWALRQTGVASTLVGGRTPAHLDQAFAALALAADVWTDGSDDDTGGGLAAVAGAEA